jgi:hypothetical protein
MAERKAKNTAERLEPERFLFEVEIPSLNKEDMPKRRKEFIFCTS